MASFAQGGSVVYDVRSQAILTDLGPIYNSPCRSIALEKATNTDMRPIQSKHKKAFHGRQCDIFHPETSVPADSSNDCRIVDVGKRRDGGTRYWCLQHKADATAKYGRPADHCRASQIPPVKESDILSLDLRAYAGGIALWGAVPPIYDTTRLPLDRGIHVHARTTKNDDKQIDATYRMVRLVGAPGALRSAIVFSELEAIYYMVSTVFGFDVSHVECEHCGDSHLDKDWFSVHPHQRHLCAGCGRYFRDTRTAIGNPVFRAREACGVGKNRQLRPATKKLRIRQADFPGGIQVWGSNPAIIWTSAKDEEEGIHVHVFSNDGAKAEHDDTFAEVVIDGFRLDPVMVRTLMAQNAMPHIAGRVTAILCTNCAEPNFDNGEDGFTPKTDHVCLKCGHGFRSAGRLRKVIGNPLLGTLAALAERAPRPPQKHESGLLPETL